MKVYVVSLLARPVDSDKVWQFAEYASTDKEKVEKFLRGKKREEVVTVNDQECFAVRGVIDCDID